MLNYTDLKKGIQFIFEGEPYEVLEANPLKKAQRRVVIQTKIRNLITGSVFDRNFHQGNTFEEAELSTFSAKFIYAHRDRYIFAEEKNSSKRFELSREQIGPAVRFLKAGQEVRAEVFGGKIINISVPIKVQLKVTEAPPGVRGDRAQGGTKTVVLETGAQIGVPLFIEEGDIVEINTETEEYVRRAE
ncbi:MAG: elongation factor P [Candidatus Nealsonbacteria bacterium]|nr:elongation factor P [Candidatus Nealsonbacteria bacterium]